MNYVVKKCQFLLFWKGFLLLKSNQKYDISLVSRKSNLDIRVTIKIVTGCEFPNNNTEAQCNQIFLTKKVYKIHSFVINFVCQFFFLL